MQYIYKICGERVVLSPLLLSHSSSSIYRGLNNYLSCINHGAKGPGSWFQNLNKPFSITDKNSSIFALCLLFLLTDFCLTPAVSAIRIKVSVVL